MKNIYMIGNTHFDPVWLWKWEEAMTSIHSTFRSALDRMNEDKDFVYSFATPIVFEWIKNIDPDMFEEIKQRVAEGRWDVCEGWYLQPDCFSGSGESYARQSLYGQHYLMDNFGKYSESVFNIDSFGHNAATPQILKKSHMKYYCMCRPENRHTPLEEPYFNWVSKDGSVVKAFRGGQFTEIYNKDMFAAIAKTEELLKNCSCDEMAVYGVTNHGGAPTKKAIADIHALNEIKDYNLVFSTVSNFFENQNEPKITVEGEMITKDFGVYTNNHLIKKRNRITEYALTNAEKSAVIAEKVNGTAYPREKLKACWEDLMFNQFHDILGGASIKQAYFDAYNGQGRAILTAEEIIQFNLQRIIKQVATLGKNGENPWNVVVWNLNDSDYTGYLEAELQWLHEFPAYEGGIVLEDEKGTKYDCQIILERSVIKGFRSRFLFKATIPAFGYKSFKVIKTENEKAAENKELKYEFSNGNIEVKLNKSNGLIESVKNLKTGKVYTNILKPVVYEDLGDTWCFNVSSYGKQLEDFKLESISVLENGIHRTTLKAVYSFRNSLVTLYYKFYNDYNYFDLEYSVNWNEKYTVLKLVSDTNEEKLIASAPFTAEERNDTDRDNPMGEWISLEGENEGISFIADSIFSYTKYENQLKLSVIRSCIYGDLRLDELDNTADYPIMEQGICEGKVRAVIHSGSAIQNDIPTKAAAFNNNPLVMIDANHEGKFESCGKFVSVNTDSGVYVSALKKSEKEEAEIIRLVELSGKEHNVVLNYFGKDFNINIEPYEIKTVKIEKETLKAVYITED